MNDKQFFRIGAVVGVAYTVVSLYPYSEGTEHRFTLVLLLILYVGFAMTHSLSWVVFTVGIPYLSTSFLGRSIETKVLDNPDTEQPNMDDRVIAGLHILHILYALSLVMLRLSEEIWDYELLYVGGVVATGFYGFVWSLMAFVAVLGAIIQPKQFGK